MIPSFMLIFPDEATIVFIHDDIKLSLVELQQQFFFCIKKEAFASYYPLSLFVLSSSVLGSGLFVGFGLFLNILYIIQLKLKNIITKINQIKRR